MHNPRTFIPAYLAALYILISLFCASSSFAAGPADKAEDREHCKECGMDLAPFGQSRMLIVYSDGTTAEVCSLHCAAAEYKTEQRQSGQIHYGCRLHDKRDDRCQVRNLGSRRLEGWRYERAAKMGLRKRG